MTGTALRCFILVSLLLPLSGCVEPQVYILKPIDGVLAWDEWSEGRSGRDNTSKVARPGTFLAPDGFPVDGTYVKNTKYDIETFVPYDGRSTARVDKSGYYWTTYGAREIGHLLAGRPLQTGMENEEFLGGHRVRWHVVSADDTELRLNVSYDTSATNYPPATADAYFLLTFRDHLPVPVHWEWHRKNVQPSITEATNFTVLGTAAPPPPVPPALPPAEVAPGSPFRLWENQTFTFEDAQAVWSESERSRDAWRWVVEHDAIPFEVWYTLLDENEGNGTARMWQAAYVDPETSQVTDFMVQWRVTHPELETRLRYPLYDACAEGCLFDEWSRREVGTLRLNGTLSPWPAAGVTMESAVARLEALGLGEPTAAFWRLTIDGRRGEDDAMRTLNPLAQPELILSTDEQRQEWDMEPGVPEIHGRLKSHGHAIHAHTTQDYGTGNLSAVMFARE